MMRAWRLLASHNLALWLIGLLAAASLLGGTLPQSGRLSPEQRASLLEEWGWLSYLLDISGFSNIFGAVWFDALYIMLLLSLVAGTALSLSRRYSWYRGETPPQYQLEKREAPPLHLLSPHLFLARPVLHMQGLAGIWGLPLFHAGIVIIVLGGIWSGSVGFGAHLELSEGEIYSGRQEKLAPDRGKAPPVDIDALLRLERVYVEISEQNRLLELQARFSYNLGDSHVRHALVETNRPLKLGIYELSPNNTGGYSAVFERVATDGSRRRLYVHFDVPLTEWNWGEGWSVHRDAVVTFDDIPLFFNMRLHGGDEPSLELKVTRDFDTVFDGRLIPGAVADVGPYRLIFMGTVPWLGFYLTSDYPKYIVFAGFIITLAGFLVHLLFRPRRIEVTREGDSWRVRAWTMQGDWEFAQRWRGFSSQISGKEARSGTLAPGNTGC